MVVGMGVAGSWTRFWGLCILVLAVIPSVLGDVPTYLKIKSPSASNPWLVGQSNAITWTSAFEGVAQFDVELARLKTDGLLFVARNVSTSWNSLNVMLDAVPTGDDYYVLFLDSTHGLVYSMSERFSIVPAGNTPSSGSVLPAVPTASVVTLQGGPNPTAQFAFTFAAAANGADSRWGAAGGFGWQTGWGGKAVMAGLVAMGAVVGSMVALW